MSNWAESRRIAKRLIITGDLELLSPAHLGNGDTEGSTDMPLLRDEIEDIPLLSGSSITGALRAYLLTRIKGYRAKESQRGKHNPKSIVEVLFGGTKGDEEGDQSPLIIEDALAHPIVPEIRDGVRIEAKTRTAKEGFKFDGEFLPPGTTFALRFELLATDDLYDQQKAILAAALQALEVGEIAIGARKTRGFGRCRVTSWRVIEFNLSEPDILLAWLQTDQDSQMQLPHAKVGLTIASLLTTPIATDVRKYFSINATFALISPLLIRSEEPLTDDDHQPDFAHLRNGRDQPILSATSLAGALRARALRILKTLGLSENLLDALFGKDMVKHNNNPTASRLVVDESVISQPNYLVQSRIAIDRFTGAASDTALFAEAPQVGGEVELKLQIHNPCNAEIGLLLLLLKDLWTSDLPLGGSSSIGRGQLQGIKAELKHKHNSDSEPEHWKIEQINNRLVVEGNIETLQGFVEDLQGATHAKD